MDQVTPRITSRYLDSFVGQVVMIVGKVAQLRGDTAVVDSDGNITAQLNRVCFGQVFLVSPLSLSLRFSFTPLQKQDTRQDKTHLAYLVFD